jgi:Mg-chelatase subunit ChlD
MLPRTKNLVRHFSLSTALACCVIIPLLSAAQTPAPDTAEANSAAVTAPVATPSAVPATTSRAVAGNNDAVSIGIVVDESSAMRTDALTVKQAVDRLVKPMRDDDEAFVVTARDKPELVQDFTSDPEEINRQLNHLKMKGKTPLFDSIMTALNHLDDASNDRKALVVLASGDDDASRASLNQVREKLADLRTVPVYCIAAKNSSWQSQGLLQQLAAANGGAALFPRREKDISNASAEISKRVFGENALTAKEKPLANYYAIVVRSIPVAPGADTADFPQGDNVILEKLLVRRLRSKNLFSQVIDGTTPDGMDRDKSQTPASNGSLELLGTVVKYKPADRRERRLIRMGGRSALVKVQFLFRDSATGKIVMHSVNEGKVDTGLMGGSADKVETEAVKRVVDRLVEDIERNR